MAKHTLKILRCEHDDGDVIIMAISVFHWIADIKELNMIEWIEYRLNMQRGGLLGAFPFTNLLLQ